jgi:co-chaperonin GroES (HSP10)
MRDATTTRQLADSFEPLSLRPSPRQALVKVITPKMVSEGGIILPDIAAASWTGAPAPSMRRWCGEVMRIGDDPEWDSVEVGDVVTWGKYTNDELVHQGDTYVILGVEQVESVIDRELSGERQGPDMRGSWDPDGEG